jgi:hypothetical protein
VKKDDAGCCQPKASSFFASIYKICEAMLTLPYLLV